MENRNRLPIGIELVRRGLVTEQDVDKAVEYQKTHPTKKLGDIIKILGLCDEYRLIEAIGEIIGEKAVLLGISDIQINFSDYISLDVAKQCLAIPFDISNGKIKVCFADTSNSKSIEIVRLLLLNKGLVMEKYVSFESNIENVLRALEGKASDNINEMQDVTTLIDNVIKTGITKRASDIHVEPQDTSVRIRYRIDGELITVANINKDKQNQIIGRLKAISNMHQEKQEAQDGRILMYNDYNIRVSSQKNIYGEKFVLRLLRKNSAIKTLNELGFPKSDDEAKKVFNKRNSIAVIAAPTGEGKTTSLYSIIDLLNTPEINITTIEDPVEIRIDGLNQIEVDAKANFSNALRTVLRQDPDIILVGEIRDNETAEIAMQAGQTGHYVLSTIHTIDSIEVVTRLRKMGISNYDIASTLATTVSQRLIRRICPECAQKREFTDEEKEIIQAIGNRYKMNINLDDKYTFKPIGCASCNNTGYYGRIGIFEILEITDKIREIIINNGSSIDIRNEALMGSYRPIVVDGLNKVLSGVTTLDELNKKLVIY